jgi:hypothetical protein
MALMEETICAIACAMLILGGVRDQDVLDTPHPLNIFGPRGLPNSMIAGLLFD